MQGVAARLKAAGIPYEMKERAASIYEHFIVKDMMAYLLLAKGVGEREQMLQVMNKPSRYISREAVGEGRVDFDRIRGYYDRTQMPDRQRREAKDRLSVLERQLLSVRKRPLRLTISFVLKGLGYENYLKAQAKSDPEKWEEWQELLEWLKEDAAAYEDAEEWLHFQEEYAKTLEQKKETGRKQGTDGKNPSAADGARRKGAGIRQGVDSGLQ